MKFRYPELTLNAWLRFDAIARGLRRIQPTSIVEFGTGQGAMAAWLAQRYSYVGVEPDDASRAVAQQRVAALGRGSIVDSAASVEGTFDAMCSFEVLEHIEDDVAALTEWSQRLRSRGWLLASVPAHPERYGAGDRAVGHIRRYSRADLEQHLDAAGFDVVQLDCYGTGLGYALERVRNLLIARRQHDDLAVASAGSGRLFQPTAKVISLALAIAAAPFRVLQRPWDQSGKGIGWVVLAQKRA